MPILSADLLLRYAGRNIPGQFQSISIDEDAVFSSYVLTSNQSNVAVNFGPVATGQAVYLFTDQSLTFALNSGTNYLLDTNGFFAVWRTSMSALTLTNNQTNNTAIITIGIFGT